MKVQNKLVYWNTVLFTIVFIVTGVLFMITYTHYAASSTHRHLKSSAEICAMFHLEEDELLPGDFAKVRYQYKESVSNIYYQVYGEDNKLKYGLNLDTVPGDTLDIIRKKKSYYFNDEEYYAYGIFYHDNQGNFVIITKEKKDILRSQQKTLFVLLVLGMFISSIMIFFVSKFIAYRAFKPFRDINKAAQNLINNKKGPLQLIVPESKDELAELICILNKLLKQLEENSVIQKNFVRYVTHEFKTPIAAIKGNLEVFLIKDRTPEEYQELANKLIREVDGLTQIINTLLAISDIRTNQNIRIAQVDFYLDALVKEIIEHIRYNHANSNISFQDFTESLIEVKGDRTQINMALSNLIENAVKYSNGKQVDVSIHEAGEHLKLIIKDSGIGIPKEQIPLLSTPFYRADNAGSKSGSGIGMSIALRILDKNGIKYDIDSVLDEGTNVTVIF